MATGVASVWAEAPTALEDGALAVPLRQRALEAILVHAGGVDSARPCAQSIAASLNLLLIAISHAVGLDLTGDCSSSVGSSSNLLADSTSIADMWTRVGGGLRTQLHPNLGLGWSGRWTLFREHPELNGDLQELDVDFQKGRMSDQVLYYAGLKWLRNERDDETYRLSERDLSLKGVVHYQARVATSFRAGIAGSSSSFPSFELADQHRLTIFGGLDHYFADGSALALEAGWDRVAYVNLSEDPKARRRHGSGQPSASGSVVLHKASLLSRYARSLGSKTELTLSARSDNIVAGANEILSLPETEILPPEVFFFGEQAVDFGLRRFLPWRSAARIQALAWRKSYLDAIRVSDPEPYREGRTDWGIDLSTEIWRSFWVASPIEIESRLSATWLKVDSSDEYFDQESWAGNLSLVLVF